MMRSLCAPALLVLVTACTDPAIVQQRALRPGHEYRTTVRMENRLLMERQAGDSAAAELYFEDERVLETMQDMTVHAAGAVDSVELRIPLYRTANRQGIIEADLRGWTARAAYRKVSDSLALDTLLQEGWTDGPMQDPAAEQVRLAEQELEQHFMNTLALLQSSLREPSPALRVGETQVTETHQQMGLGPYVVSWTERHFLDLVKTDGERAEYRIRLEMNPDTLEGVELSMEAAGSGYSLYDLAMEHTIRHDLETSLELGLKADSEVWRASSSSSLAIRTEIRPRP